LLAQPAGEIDLPGQDHRLGIDDGDDGLGLFDRGRFVKGQDDALGQATAELYLDQMPDGQAADSATVTITVLSVNDVPTAADQAVGTDEDAALQYLKDSGDIVEVGDEGVIHRDALAQCVDELKRLFERQQEVSVGDVKDALGVTRKHAIPLLEALDDRRVTKRVGNNRVKGPRFPD